MATNPLRIPITNVFLGSDYTGLFYIGAGQRPANLLLDTGSSTLAVESQSYNPLEDKSMQPTDMAQEISYADRSGFVASVVKTDVTVKSGSQSDKLTGVAVGVAYRETPGIFGKAQGIIGLAYAALDTAYILSEKTVPPDYKPNDFRTAHTTQIEPYFTQLAQSGLAAGKYAFYTRRSVIHASANPSADPQNNGVLILGGGEEATDLYTGTFQTASVLSDDWYSVNLTKVLVGGYVIEVPPPTYQDQTPTNAVVDSGTNELVLSPFVFNSILGQLSTAQRNLVRHGGAANASINLAEWPPLTFILQGPNGDVTLQVPPSNYWQLDALEAGQAQCMLSKGGDVQSILGLPLMNGYFTVFDDTANHGLGAVKFAKIK